MSSASRRHRQEKQRRRDHDRRIGGIWRQLQPVEPPSGFACPDCGASPSPDLELIHEPTCPLQNAMEDAIAGDADFSDAHPGALVRRRPPVMAEILGALLVAGKSLPALPPGCRWEPAGVVVVNSVGDGVRMRELDGAYLAATPAVGAVS